MTLRNRHIKPLVVACIAATLMLGIGVRSGAEADDQMSQEHRPISIDVRDMEIGEVLRMVGQAAGVNIIVGQGVSGEIQSLSLHNVSVETALRLITETNGYYWSRDDNVYVVSAQSRAPEPPEAREESVEPPVSPREGAEGQPQGDDASIPAPPGSDIGGEPPSAPDTPDIATELIPLSYANAAEVAALFGGSSAATMAQVSGRGVALNSQPRGGDGRPFGAMSTNRGTLGTWGMPQFGAGDEGAGDFGGGFDTGGDSRGTSRGTSTGTGTSGRGTVTLPGEMEEPVAIMSHNALLVRGTREELDEFRETLNLLDMPQKQVEIATKWIDVSTTASEGLGIDWAVTNGALEIYNMGFAPGEAANNGVRYGRGRWWAELAVLQNNSQATVINEPRVTCMNGMPGMIAFETQIPYFSATISYNQFGQRTVDYTSDEVEVANELWVVPQINPDDSIRMMLAPVLEDQVGTVEGPNGESIPIVTSQYVETMVRVKDGETIVLGGVIRKDESVNLRSTPLLSQIPIIGKLFQAKSTERSDTELLIFVTPKIVRDQATA